MGRLSDVVGRKRVYVSGFAVFVLGALLARLSTSIVTLIPSRVVMGIGSAMTQGTSTAIVVSAFPESEREKDLGLQMSAVGSGGVAGPVLGGFIVGALGWRGVFLATALLGLVAIIAGQVVLDERRVQSGSGSRFDWLGAALSSSVLITFLLALSSGAQVGWASPPITEAFFGLVLLVGVFVWWELRAANPMLDIRLFRRRQFFLGIAARFSSFLGVSSVRFLLPFYLQVVSGYTPRRSV